AEAGPGGERGAGEARGTQPYSGPPPGVAAGGVVPRGSGRAVRGPSQVAGVVPSGRRRGSGSAGRMIGPRDGSGPALREGTVDAVGTVMAAVSRHAAGAGGSGADARGLLGYGPVEARAADLREQVREQRRSACVVLALDTSGSMGAEARVAAARGAVEAALSDAYQARDQVAVVGFGGEGARVLLRPTGSVEVARARLAELRTGGCTPLAGGLLAALDVARDLDARGVTPVLLLVTDGRATAAGSAGGGGVASDRADGGGVALPAAGGGLGSPAAGDRGPFAAALEVASRVAALVATSVVVDVESGRARLGLARRLAESMGASYVQMPDPSAEELHKVLDAHGKGSLAGRAR
ncbi:MAG: VWA domain-containing protein, partial [Acidimicrobiales bacterium]